MKPRIVKGHFMGRSFWRVWFKFKDSNGLYHMDLATWKQAIDYLCFLYKNSHIVI